MNIQTLSLLVPTNACVNKCKFCISRLNPCNDYYTNLFHTNFIEFKRSYEKRIKYAIQNDVNTCIITGTGEALQNNDFIVFLSNIFHQFNHPFPNVELQTSGVMLNLQKIYDLKNSLKLNTVSLSVADIFNDDNNSNIIGISPKLKFKLEDLCKLLKENNINIRISLNMTNLYENTDIDKIFERVKELGACQLTFRELFYYNDDHENHNNEINTWVIKNKLSFIKHNKINDYVKTKGIARYVLPFGATVYDCHDIGVVIDNDCMGTKTKDTLKYLVLREDGKLYSHWDIKFPIF